MYLVVDSPDQKKYLIKKKKLDGTLSKEKILGCKDPRYKHKYLDKRENTE